MKTQVIAALLLAVCVSAATSACASSRYPKPQGGATVSQRDRGSETPAIEHPAADAAVDTDTHQAHRHVVAGPTHPGSRMNIATQENLYAHH
jgi:hypothetical protein